MESPQLQVDGDGWPVGPFPVAGRAMRYLVLAELIRSGDALSVAELVGRLRQQGLLLPTRSSKVVWDAVRWEVRKSRIVKLQWGVYRVGSIPRSTRYWVLDQARGYRARHLAEPA